MESAVDDIAAITNKQDAEIASLRAELAKSQELQQTVRRMLGAEIDCIRQQRERLRAKLDRLEDAADEDAATVFSLRSELAAKDIRIGELDSALLSHMDDWAEETIEALRAELADVKEQLHYANGLQEALTASEKGLRPHMNWVWDWYKRRNKC